jgi:hypothetical protein
MPAPLMAQPGDDRPGVELAAARDVERDPMGSLAESAALQACGDGLGMRALLMAAQFAAGTSQPTAQ